MFPTRLPSQSLTLTVLAVAAVLAMLWALPAAAVEPGPGSAPVSAADADETGAIERTRVEKEKALEALRHDIEAQRAAETALNAEIDQLGDDRAALNEELIATAARIQDIETAIGALEDRVAVFASRETELRGSLRARSGLLAELIGALQRMGRRPPPAVLVSPEDALRTVRTAILLGAVLPDLRIETEALASDLQELARLRRQIDGERARLVGSTRDLENQRRRIAALLDAKRATASQTESELAAVRRRAEELAGEARSLEELIASMDQEIEVARNRAEAPPPRPLTPREALDALNNPSRLEPAIAFADAKGRLPMPVAGALVRSFGAPDEFGAAARGISVATRSQAQVTAPSDGWVVYAGPFRSYGQLLILNAGSGYHVLLAGMESIAVELGQFVLAGEPVGAMGGLVLASAANVTVGRSQPILYIEFRKDGHSVDPAPWWAEGRTGAGG